ncbi:MAG: hypothetical protein V1899_08880 [Planctomycetota bacterium]
MNIARQFAFRHSVRGASSTILLIIIAAVVLALMGNWLFHLTASLLKLGIYIGVLVLIFLVIVYCIRAIVKKMD